MSRAILKMLLARTIQREPSHTELAEFLAHCRDLGGERIYVPKGAPDHEEQARIRAMAEANASIRRIAREVGCSKSQVHRVLSQIPVAIVDSNY